MPRLFVGIDPPFHIKQQLLDIMGGLSGARWQTAEQLHLTLRFIGNVGEDQAAQVRDALRCVRHPVFHLSVAGTGSFDRRGRAHALWAGVTPHAPLLTLYKLVEGVVTSSGLPAEDRPYRPHITLARCNLTAGEVSGFLTSNRILASEPFLVDAICLYESRLTPGGSQYDITDRYPLS